MTEATDAVIAVDSRPRISGEEAWALATLESERLLHLLRSLTEADWSRPTDCTGWDVRAMLGHLVGGAEGIVSTREFIHQYRTGTRLVKEGKAGGKWLVDGINATQVLDRAGASTDELIIRYERAIPKEIRRRRRLLRFLPGSIDDVGGRISFRELYEVVITRDTWIHRVDISRATGREMVMTADHDGRIVEDLVIDWAKRHGQPFSLVLTGPAGGRFQIGRPVSTTEVDAIEFARALSGRGTRPETLGTRAVF
ncbi:MAG: maleylpyruvate isomerase family mycothiol-dependent enzyme [Candidatus Dormibacteraeota bacterium]|nr:maleylpyruvate isomerase family mycothiol-dependent enzyme [Candidatus Dormibacteraeota bacterium]